jgi:hypothetical protein
MRNLLSAAALAICCFVWPAPAKAYGDLTNASYMAQMILGMIFGGLLSIKMVPSLLSDWMRGAVRVPIVEESLSYYRSIAVTQEMPRPVV